MKIWFNTVMSKFNFTVNGVLIFLLGTFGMSLFPVVQTYIAKCNVTVFSTICMIWAYAMLNMHSRI